MDQHDARATTNSNKGNAGAGLTAIGMSPGRRRSMRRSRSRSGTRRKSTGRIFNISRQRRRSRSGRNLNFSNKEILALSGISLLTILAFVSLLDLPVEYIIAVLQWIEEDTVRGIFIFVLALTLAIPFFLPITKILYVSLGFFYGFFPGWCLAMLGVSFGFLLTFSIGRFVCKCCHDYINYRAEVLIGRRKWIAIQKLLLRDGIYCKCIYLSLIFPISLSTFSTNHICFFLTCMHTNFTCRYICFKIFTVAL
jgi:uncharacterized membrane protein YdjX (TVP38/TMEM64 family)